MSVKIVAFMATMSPVGGVATWLDHFHEYCERKGIRLTVGLVQGQREHNPDRYRQFHSNLNSVVVDGRGLPLDSRIRACQRLIRRCKADIVLPLGVLDANAAAIREKRQRDLYLVGRAQGNLPPMLADLEDLRPSLDHVVCVGAMTREFLVRNAGFVQERVTHIPNGARQAVEQHGGRRPNEPLRIGYVGRLSNGDKRVMDIPELCQNLQRREVDYRFTIVGSGSAEKQLKESLVPYADRVEMLGAKPSEEVYREIFPNLDVLVLLSSSETFGIVLAEAMMNSVVPVTSQYLGFQSERLVVDARHGLSFPVGDMDSAGEQIQRLANDVDLWATLSRQAYEHAKGNYTWQRCLRSWGEVLERIRSTPPIRPPETFRFGELSQSGKLDRLGVPPAAVDLVRRVRRRVFGSNLTDGQEWPLFHRTHDASRLTQIHERCLAIESQHAG